MTVTINLPPEKEAAFKAQARARGLSVEDWLLQLAEIAASKQAAPTNDLVNVCAMVSGLADDLTFIRNPSTGRAGASALTADAW